MTEALASYRSLELRLWAVRWRHEGSESPEEDSTLEEMDVAWSKLSEAERELLRSEGPRCWPMDASAWPPSVLAVLGSSSAAWPYEGFTSPYDAIIDADAADAA